MRIVLTDGVYKDINNLFDRKVYLTNNAFCQSFIFFCKKMEDDMNSLKQMRNTFSVRGAFRISTISAMRISYRLFPYAKAIVIYSIGFIGLRHLHRMCAFERKMQGKSLGRRPAQITASKSVSDYQGIPNNNGGTIGHIPVKIVRRKNITSVSGKPLFNYLWNGRIISKVDFLSCNPFSMVDGVEKATAYGANGKKYWIMPSGRRLLYCSNIRINKRILAETKHQGKVYRRLAEYTVVDGDEQPNVIKGLEQYGNDLYDYRMYDSKNITYCIFSLGKHSKKFICCKLEYDKEWGTWLGFTPIRRCDVPTIIIQDLKNAANNGSILRKIVSNVIKEIVNEEYKVVGGNEMFDYGNGKKGHSIITLKDEYGGESKIIEDDGCYVLYNKVGDEYEPSPYIYPEAFNAMKKLPNLPLR